MIHDQVSSEHKGATKNEKFLTVSWVGSFDVEVEVKLMFEVQCFSHNTTINVPIDVSLKSFQLTDSMIDETQRASSGGPT